MGAVEIFLKQVLMFVINLKADGKYLQIELIQPIISIINKLLVIVVNQT